MIRIHCFIALWESYEAMLSIAKQMTVLDFPVKICVVLYVGDQVTPKNILLHYSQHDYIILFNGIIIFLNIFAFKTYDILLNSRNQNGIS